jgi:hypothetical protein
VSHKSPFGKKRKEILDTWSLAGDAANLLEKLLTSETVSIDRSIDRLQSPSVFGPLMRPDVLGGHS